MPSSGLPARAGSAGPAVGVASPSVVASSAVVRLGVPSVEVGSAGEGSVDTAFGGLAAFGGLTASGAAAGGATAAGGLTAFGGLTASGAATGGATAAGGLTA